MTTDTYTEYVANLDDTEPFTPSGTASRSVELIDGGEAICTAHEYADGRVILDDGTERRYGIRRSLENRD